MVLVTRVERVVGSDGLGHTGLESGLSDILGHMS